MKTKRWNAKAKADIVERHPALEGKKDSVAIAVWVLEADANASPDDFREVSESTGVPVRGRAIGSARQMLGLSSGTPVAAKKRKTTGAKRGPKPGAKRAAKSVTTGASTLDQIVGSIRDTERERDRAVDTLRKVRDMIDGIL